MSVFSNMTAMGPLIAFVVIAGLALILRWAFDGDVARKQAKIFERPAAPTGSEDYGLLATAGVVASDDEAETLQRLLADAGIRSTATPAPGGRVSVLVFTTDLEPARRVVGGSTI